MIQAKPESLDVDDAADADAAEKIEGAASLMVERYGDAALLMASITADEMIAKRNQQGIATWMLIRAAVRRRINRVPRAYDAH